MSKLENDFTIFQKFNRYDYIICREFLFITRSTFYDIKVSELDYMYHGAKTPEQKEQVIKICKIFENYFDSINHEKPKEVGFISRSDGECMTKTYLIIIRLTTSSRKYSCDIFHIMWNI